MTIPAFQPAVLRTTPLINRVDVSTPTVESGATGGTGIASCSGIEIPTKSIEYCVFFCSPTPSTISVSLPQSCTGPKFVGPAHCPQGVEATEALNRAPEGAFVTVTEPCHT